MQLNDIVVFWSQQRRNDKGQWVHPADEAVFNAALHTFNLDFPVSPYVGDILRASVIILGANAGYDPDKTATEFPDEDAVRRYVNRVRSPSEADWSFVSTYYEKVNYGPWLATGRVALINACPYRSPKISVEPENRRLLERLPSTAFTRRWLRDAVLPLADEGKRLVVAKRPGLWNLPPILRQAEGIVFDPVPVSPQITSKPWAIVKEWLNLP
ncbi:MAG TPA: hypothetical protein DCS07_15880 [Bdellovibrionales bacterium]|nr:hypothetical protein [Bdellovibrionales bacterium]